MFKQTNVNKYCFYLTPVLYKITVYHALFCNVFFLISIQMCTGPKNSIQEPQPNQE